jgi:hypothetical protein
MVIIIIVYNDNSGSPEPYAKELINLIKRSQRRTRSGRRGLAKAQMMLCGECPTDVTALLSPLLSHSGDCFRVRAEPLPGECGRVWRLERVQGSLMSATVPVGSPTVNRVPL